jgi:hypothetical protein
MNHRAKKILLLLLTAALLFGAGRTERALNRERDRLGLTQAATLQDAPPLLAFTTVALGGFRGLISNYLWIRANDLQQNDKFFEAAQLANWITDLEPHFAQVWIFQAWNMAYNISVKFKENAPGNYADRWRWVLGGVELLRDKGLRYNPNALLIYRELAWFFQNKMGQNLDDGNLYYKQQWAEAMTPFFGPQGTNIEALVHPQTAEERTNALLLKEKFKMDPAYVEKVNDEWGPLDWRVPEASAIYWAQKGLDEAKAHPQKVNKDDLITLRRVIYQSELQMFHHGRIISNPFIHGIELAPNLDLVDRVNDAYLTEMKEAAPGDTNNIANAHRNFLRDAVYFLYVNNRIAEAAKWFQYLGQQYPDKPILDGDTNSLPKNLTLDEYAIACVQGDVNETSQERVTSAIMGLLEHSYLDLAIGQDDRAFGFQRLAQKIYDHYYEKIGKDQPRVALPPMAQLKKTVLNDLLDPQKDLIPYAARAVIRSQLGLPAESAPTNAPSPPSTNAVAPSAAAPLNRPPAAGPRAP